MHCMRDAGSALAMSGEPSGNVYTVVAAIDFEWLHLCKIILLLRHHRCRREHSDRSEAVVHR